MRSWSLAMTMAAAAFASSLGVLLVSRWLPYLEAAARSFVVGTGALLAAFIVGGLWETLLRQQEAPRRDARPLVSMHPRHIHSAPRRFEPSSDPWSDDPPSDEPRG